MTNYLYDPAKPTEHYPVLGKTNDYKEVGTTEVQSDIVLDKDNVDIEKLRDHIRESLKAGTTTWKLVVDGEEVDYEMQGLDEGPTARLVSYD